MFSKQEPLVACDQLKIWSLFANEMWLCDIISFVLPAKRACYKSLSRYRYYLYFLTQCIVIYCNRTNRSVWIIVIFICIRQICARKQHWFYSDNLIKNNYVTEISLVVVILWKTMYFFWYSLLMRIVWYFEKLFLSYYLIQSYRCF